MGRATTEDLASNRMFPMETMLYNHLAFNLYPGQGEFIDVALAAIELAKQGEWDATINIAEIMGDEKYNHAAPVHKVMESWHLEFFIQDDEEDY